MTNKLFLSQYSDECEAPEFSTYDELEGSVNRGVKLHGNEVIDTLLAEEKALEEALEEAMFWIAFEYEQAGLDTAGDAVPVRFARLGGDPKLDAKPKPRSRRKAKAAYQPVTDQAWAVNLIDALARTKRVGTIDQLTFVLGAGGIASKPFAMKGERRVRVKLDGKSSLFSAPVAEKPETPKPKRQRRRNRGKKA